MAIGQAAGTAAGLVAARGVQPRQLEVEALQKQLLAHGASLWRDKKKAELQRDKAQAAIRDALAAGKISGLQMREHEGMIANFHVPRL